jgi:hypothetical protein
MAKLIFSALLILLVVAPTAASDQEDAAADAVATAFLQVRQTAHLSKLERMGRNTFREKLCKQDMRFPSGGSMTLFTKRPIRRTCLSPLNDWQHGQIPARLRPALDSASAC